MKIPTDIKVVLVVIFMVAPTMLGGVAAYDWIKAYYDPVNIVQRLQLQGDIEAMLNISEDSGANIRKRILALQALPKIAADNSSKNKIEARLTNLRDSSDNHAIQINAKQALTTLNRDSIVNIIETSLARVREPVRMARQNRLSGFLQLEDGERVDLVLDFEGEADQPRLSFPDSHYNADVLSGLNKSEIEAYAAQISRVGAIVRYSRVVGHYEGVDVNCSGNAYQHFADLYLVDVVESQILAFRHLEGGDPPRSISGYLSEFNCDGTGSKAAADMYFH